MMEDFIFYLKIHFATNVAIVLRAMSNFRKMKGIKEVTFDTIECRGWLSYS